MKKMILFLILLNSCSINNTAKYWNSNLKKEVLNFDNEYTYKEYKIILKKYNDRTDYPNIN